MQSRLAFLCQCLYLGEMGTLHDNVLYKDGTPRPAFACACAQTRRRALPRAEFPSAVPAAFSALLPVLLLCLWLGLAGCAAKHSSESGGEQSLSASTAPATGTAGSTSATDSAAPHTPVLRYSADFAFAPAYAPPNTPGHALDHAPQTSPADGKTSAQADAPPPELLRALNAGSLLLKLKDSPPDDMQGLEFRIDKDEAEALRLLQAFGYYDGTVQRTVLAPGETAPAPAATAKDGDNAPAAPGTPATSGADPKGQSKTALWRVYLTLTPGPRYTMGETVVHYVDGPAPAPTSPDPTTPASAAPASAVSPSKGLASDQAAALPSSLEDAGLTAHSPAEATRVLRAVERLPEILGRRGYPLAEVKGTRYAVDKNTRQLFATVLVQAGPRARMGRVVVRGDSEVQPAYLEKLRPWEQGTAWDQQWVEDYRDLLVRQGLFRSIELHPEPAAATAQPAAQASAAPTSGAVAAPTGTNAGTGTQGSAEPLPSLQSSQPLSASSSPTATPVYDLVATLADAPQRTVGGGLNYESNRGPGVQAYWEHRNLLGQGERFRAEASVWQDSQFARATFRKPAFFDRSQEFTAEAWLRNEDTDAYTQRAGWLSAGLERRLWGPLFASAGVAVEGGDLKDPTHPLRAYTMAGFPLQVRYEGASGPGGAQLDPERGLRASLGVRPSWGEYAGSFFITPTRLTLSGYLPLGNVGTDADTGRAIPRVVLAARGAAGTLWRGDSQRIPASARYYGGGGGSVRGYAYQSLGPRDHNNDPLGGASFAELSMEARVRITENIAIVPFLDGGNVYSGVTPGFENDGRTTGLQWGAGLGLRYHTAVGPLRLDVATPLNPREDDGKFFLYISIGQSF